MPAAKPERKNAFLTDIQEIRRRAREHIEKGAVTEGYRADRNAVVKVLNEALATEIVCVLRYKRHYYISEIYSARMPMPRIAVRI